MWEFLHAKNHAEFEITAWVEKKIASGTEFKTMYVFVTLALRAKGFQETPDNR